MKKQIQNKVDYWFGTIVLAVGILGLIGSFQIGVSILFVGIGIILRRKK